jgi:cis-3-alkyl-4-acyloxetan-2-one decarboxylase
MTIPPAVRALFPFESRFLPLQSGHRMHYLDEGTGPPLLMLHGNPTWSFYYRDLVRDLRTSYRCIAPDHLGCGLSDKPQVWSYRITDHVDNVLELVAHLGLTGATLVTHDWGGPIGFLAAIRRPQAFARFVTFNTGATLGALPSALTLLRRPQLGSLAIQRLNGMVRAGLVATRLNGHRMGAAVRQGDLLPYDSPAHRLAILRFVQEIPLEPGHPNHALLATLARDSPLVADRPHLVIWGMRDPVFGPPYLADWQRRFPGAEVHRFEQAGHWIVEEASLRILPLMRAFLERT